MSCINGYITHEEIIHGKTLLLCRATRESDGLGVLLKMPVRGADINRAANLLEREYLITGSQAVPGTVPAMSLERSGEYTALVMNDNSWIPLVDISVSSRDVLLLATEMVRSLSLVHASGIVHRNLGAGSFLFIKDEKISCFITGFGHAARVEQPAETGKLVPRVELELSTASPEALGLIPFMPDIRSDLYSLGIIFYEMFTGIKPFNSDDETDLIYAHIAREPSPPASLPGNISPVISDIIMKLLLKDPDCRYMDTTELLRDLEAYQKNTTVEDGPPLAARRPVFTGRIYGRENEMRECMEVYESVRDGHAALILAGGPPGSGKTSLINCFTGKVVSPGALHGYSKADRHGSNIPYSGITAAFGIIIRQILTRSDTEISSWKEKFTAALAQNLPVITDVIPELESITGPQKVQPTAGDIESRNRFFISFRKFAETLASGDEPLVVFFDDIQWSDRSGLDLLASLVKGGDLKNILFICAYRDNEIREGNPLSDIVSGMKENPQHARFITIGGLPMETSVEMVNDILQSGSGGGRSFGEYIFRKTAGNPYYIREYIKTVFSDGLLSVSQNGDWEWDLQEMDMLPATESLASVLNSSMVTLDPDMKIILAACACSGLDFSPYFVAAILRVPVSGVINRLDYLEKEGYLVKADDDYRFVHDRVRETAYDFIQGQERLMLHRRSGRILFGMADDDAGIFYAVEQINLAAEIISDDYERLDLASLNFEAGEIALKRAAFAPALIFLRTAMELLPENPWDREYVLTCGIVKVLARSESVNGNTARTERIVLESIGHLRTAEEKAEFLSMLIHQMNITGRFRESIDLSFYALSLLAVDIPLDSLDVETAAEMEQLKSYIDRNGIHSLTELRENRDNRILFIIRIFLLISWPAYFLDWPVMNYVTLKMMNLTIQYGLSRETIAVFCCYIGITAATFRDYDAAFKMWKITEQIMEKLNDRYYAAEISLKTANYVIPMIMHLRESEPVNIAGYNAGYMSGEHLCAGYILAHKAVNSFHYGREIGLVLSDIDDDLAFNLSAHNFLASEVILSLQRALRYLAESSGDSYNSDTGAEHAGEDVLFTRISDNDVIFVQVNTFSLIALFIMGEYGKCLDIIRAIRDRAEAMYGIFTYTEFCFYHSLTLTSLMPDTDETASAVYREQVVSNQEKMKAWSGRCPENFLHKYLLVEAEVAGLDGRISEAMNLYDRSAGMAKENRFIQDEALANELASRFWFSAGKEDFAGIYLRKARNLYAEWGAMHKVQMIDRIYPGLIRVRSRAGNYDGDDLMIISRESAAVVCSLQAISGEIEHDRLLHTLIRNMLHFSGATRLVLMMENAGILCVEAEGAPEKTDTGIKSDIHPSVPVESFSGVPLGVVRYCWRTGNAVIVNDSNADEMFPDDPYIARFSPRSYICVKNNYGDTSVLAYFENSVAKFAFTSGKVEVLKLISVQAAISLENARLYSEKMESINKLAELGDVRDRLLRQYNEAEQRAMQKRMDPHFLYNAVHTIHSLISINPAEADRAVLLLGEMLHFLTDRSFEQLVPFNDEWRFTQLYLEFEKIRFPDTLGFTMTKTDFFNAVMIPPLTIQPLAENAIKHGLRKKSLGGVVDITADIRKELVIIEVSDTGTGLSPGDLYTRSIGNILNRLRYNFESANVDLHNNEQGGVLVRTQFSLRNRLYER